jgi:acetyl esterase
MRDYMRTYPETASVLLDPQVAADLRARADLAPFFRMPPFEARAAFESLAAAMPKLDEPIGAVEDRTIRGPGGNIGLRIYTPLGQEARASVLFIHGGGWVIGSPRSHDDLCRSLCHRAGVKVASVDYRLAPEHKFPAALHDCYAALTWLAQESGGGRLAVAGDSAGGNLSAALALYARDQGGPPLHLQVLIYPVTNHSLDTASYHQCAEGFGLMRDAMRYFWDCYLAQPSDGTQPYAAPLLAPDLRGLPPALIQTAQYDVLRDDGEAYAARLRRAGVPVECTRYLAMHHGFVQFAGQYAQGRVALQEIAARLVAMATE